MVYGKKIIEIPNQDRYKAEAGPGSDHSFKKIRVKRVLSGQAESQSVEVAQYDTGHFVLNSWHGPP